MECNNDNYVFYEPEEQEMSLFEKNLEVLKESGGDFSKVQKSVLLQANECWLNMGKFDISEICDFILRLKPQPKYRAFKDAKEFEPFRDRWVKSKIE
jgi:hypothetical protein